MQCVYVCKMQVQSHQGDNIGLSLKTFLKYEVWCWCVMQRQRIILFVVYALLQNTFTWDDFLLFGKSDYITVRIFEK